MSSDQPGLNDTTFTEKTATTKENPERASAENGQWSADANASVVAPSKAESADSARMADTDGQHHGQPTTPETNGIVHPAGDASVASDDAIQNSQAPANPPAEPPGTSSSEPTAPTRRRVELKPSVDPDRAKPVGTYSSASNAPKTEPASENSPPQAPIAQRSPSSPDAMQGDSDSAEIQYREEPVSAENVAPTGTVELPPDVENLDPELEAEIAAAMSGDESRVAAGIEVKTDDGEVEPVSEETLEKGMRLKGTVQSVDDENVFIDLGFRAPGVVKRRDFLTAKMPEAGQSLQVIVNNYDEAQGLIHVHLPRATHRVAGNWHELTVGQTVECMVTKKNKGGLEVTVSNLRGFLPASQADVVFVADLDAFVGQKLRVQVIEVNPQKRNLVVSRRALIEEERREAAERIWEALEVGQTRTGTVKTIKDYGAFVDIGGIDGFLHVGEISWSRLNHPSEVLAVGQTVEVKVLSVDKDANRIGLGMRQLVQDPWSAVEQRFPPGSTVSGQVTKTTKFGAFVMLEPGIEGLIHISELDHQRVNRVTDIVKVGQPVDVKVLDVDLERKRIGLSLKALKEVPQMDAQADASEAGDAPSSAPPPRKRKSPLKGGIGNREGGGLFGNPRDFS